MDLSDGDDQVNFEIVIKHLWNYDIYQDRKYYLNLTKI